MAQGMTPQALRVAPGTTVGLIVPEDERRRAIIIECVHATQGATVGWSSSLTATTGHPLVANRAAGSKFIVKGLAARKAMYAITGAGTSDLSIILSSDADIA